MADMAEPKQIGSKTNNKKEESKKEETFKVDGEQLLKKVKELIKEGNVRKITIKDKNGKPLVVFPLTLGVVGVAFAPVLAGIGAIAALIGECTITVERGK
jgi:hypothetical protein